MIPLLPNPSTSPASRHATVDPKPLMRNAATLRPSHWPRSRSYGLQLGGDQDRARVRGASHLRGIALCDRSALSAADDDRDRGACGALARARDRGVGARRDSAANFTATFIALQIGGAGKTAVFVYTMPFWVLVFARSALHERLTALQKLAVPFALIGLASCLHPWSSAAQALPSVLAVGAGVTWAASVVFIRHLQRKAPISMLALSFWQMVVAAATLAVGLSTFPREAPVIWSGEFVAALLFTAVVATGSARWCSTMRCAACPPA